MLWHLMKIVMWIGGVDDKEAEVTVEAMIAFPKIHTAGNRTKPWYIPLPKKPVKSHACTYA